MTQVDETQKDHSYYYGPASLSPIPLSVNSPIIAPVNKGKMTAIAVESMELQAKQQVELLREQATLLMEQARKIEERIHVSYLIYQSEFKFQPVPGKEYYLYEVDNGHVLSPISPEEWGKKMPFKAFKYHLRLLGDQTWQILS